MAEREGRSALKVPCQQSCLNSTAWNAGYRRGLAEQMFVPPDGSSLKNGQIGKFFAHEISTDPIVCDDAMRALLAEKSPELASHTKYFGPDLRPFQSQRTRWIEAPCCTIAR